MWIFLVGIVLLCQSFIDLEIHITLPFKSLNIPISDALMCLLLPVVLLRARPFWGQGKELRGFIMVIIALLLGTANALEPSHSLYTWLRKPVFMMVSYGFALTWVLKSRVSETALCRLLLSWQCITTLILLLSGLGRILAGEALWWQSIAGITPNHKALAVSLCSVLPLFWSFRMAMQRSLPSLKNKEIFWGIQMMVLLAIFLSFSKTAWLVVAFSIGWFFPRHRPISQRPILIAVLSVLGVWFMIQLPFWLDSHVMIDALRSRHSINLRVWEMFTAHPIIGMGTGTNLQYELVTFPHYRINGVDAHGMIQKLLSEAGLFGVLGLGVFFKDGRESLISKNPKMLGAYWTLFLCALLSTEILHSTWWIPYAVVMGWPRKAVEPDQISKTSSTGQ